VVESAWCYRHLPRVGEKLRKRHEGIPTEILEIAWKAQNRLHKRYTKLTMAGKDLRKITTAVARELLGFIWAIAIKAEAGCRKPMAA
jgi:transposase